VAKKLKASKEAAMISFLIFSKIYEKIKIL